MTSNFFIAICIIMLVLSGLLFVHAHLGWAIIFLCVAAVNAAMAWIVNTDMNDV